MNHQTAETKLEFALRAQHTEKELARFHLSRLIKAINNCPNHAKFFVTSTPEFEAADAYLNPPETGKTWAETTKQHAKLSDQLLELGLKHFPLDSLSKGQALKSENMWENLTLPTETALAECWDIYQIIPKEVREELHKNLRPSSSMVEPPAHNGKDAGSSPAAATTNEGEQS